MAIDYHSLFCFFFGESDTQELKYLLSGRYEVSQDTEEKKKNIYLHCLHQDKGVIFKS